MPLNCFIVIDRLAIEHDNTWLNVPNESAPLGRDKKEFWPPGWNAEREVKSERDIFELLEIPWREAWQRNCPWIVECELKMFTARDIKDKVQGKWGKGGRGGGYKERGWKQFWGIGPFCDTLELPLGPNWKECHTSFQADNSQFCLIFLEATFAAHCLKRQVIVPWLFGHINFTSSSGLYISSSRPLPRLDGNLGNCFWWLRFPFYLKILKLLFDLDTWCIFQNVHFGILYLIIVDRILRSCQTSRMLKWCYWSAPAYLKCCSHIFFCIWGYLYQDVETEVHGLCQTWLTSSVQICERKY